MHLRRLMVTTVAAACVSLLAVSLPGQTENAKPSAAEKPAATAAQSKQPSLTGKQEAIKLRYERFENMLVQMAQYMRKTDPERADLLFRAIKQSKGGQVSQVMKQIIALLEKNSLGDAVGRQAELVEQLKALLKLLQSEDRMSELEKEKLRIKDLLKDLWHVLGQQKDVRAGTERGENADRLAGRQTKVAGDTKKLVDKIDSQDAKRNAGGEGKSGEGKSGEGKSGEGKSGEGKSGEGKSGEGKSGEGKSGEGKSGEGKSGEGKSGEGKSGEGKSGEGKSGEGKSGEGKSGESSDSPSRTPGRDEIEQARKEMEKAIEELKRQKHDEASGHQDEAIAKLEKAKEKLEEILRQLREEERELLLAALEARFQKMLALQLAVYNGTVSLSKTPNKEWTARHRGRSHDLSLQEEEIVLEANKALTLLKEEGSSVAFPEAVEQLREDMQIVARRLDRGQVAELTQSIERDIIEALAEIIEALQKEMEKKDDQPPPEDQPPMQPQDPTLVDKLAELKMLRSLQMRINRRTKRLGNLIDGDQAQKPDIIEQLQNLANRQKRVQEATYNLVTGKNR